VICHQIDYTFNHGEGDFQFHVTILYSVTPPDASVGWRGSVELEGVVLDDLFNSEGLRMDVRGSGWMDMAEEIAVAVIESRDDWRDLAWEEAHSDFSS
jgi:hypothetical protein